MINKHLFDEEIIINKAKFNLMVQDFIFKHTAKEDLKK